MKYVEDERSNNQNTRAELFYHQFLKKIDWIQWISAAVGLTLLIFLGLLQRDRFFPGQNDFLQLYAGAKLSGTPDLYSPIAARRIHRESAGVELVGVYYSRPPFYADLLRPLGWLPYRAAYWTFESLSFAAFAVFLILFVPQCKELVLFSSLCFPLLSNFLNGQDVTLVLLLAAGSILAIRYEHDFVAGLLLSLCAIKGHLFVLTPLVFLIHRRWMVLAGGAVGGVALTAMSFLTDGWDWPRRYLTLLENPELHPSPSSMPNLRGLVFGITGEEFPAVYWVLTIFVVAAVVWLAWKMRDLEMAFAMSVVAGLLVGYHAYLQDAVLLLLPFAIVIAKSKAVPLRVLMALAILPPIYICLLMGRPWNVAVPVTLMAVLGVAVTRRPITG
jgi:Glycosyltransferase family 87